MKAWRKSFAAIRAQSDPARSHCYWCRRRLVFQGESLRRYTRDHVMPRCLGYTHTVACCLQCNQLKADMTLPEWQRFMMANPEWWRTFTCRSQVVRWERAMRWSSVRPVKPAPTASFKVPAPPLCRGLA